MFAGGTDCILCSAVQCSVEGEIAPRHRHSSRTHAIIIIGKRPAGGGGRRVKALCRSLCASPTYLKWDENRPGRPDPRGQASRPGSRPLCVCPRPSLLPACTGGGVIVRRRRPVRSVNRVQQASRGTHARTSARRHECVNMEVRGGEGGQRTHLGRGTMTRQSG